MKVNDNNIEKRVKEIIVETLYLETSTDEMSNELVLFSRDGQAGVFENSIAMLEVTAALMSEFDLDADHFENDNTFRSIGTLIESIAVKIAASEGVFSSQSN